MTDSSEGQRFSLAYGRRGEPADDSQRMRRRLASLIEQFSDDEKAALATEIEREQGVAMHPYAGAYSGYIWNRFLEQAKLRDVLDLVSTSMRVIRNPRPWISGVRRIFAEEHVRYRLNDAGGVRFAVDESFEHGNVATISALGGTRYQTTLATFETALTALVDIPPRGKDAIRGVFSAAEGLFRLMFPKVTRLGADEITANLKPVVESRFADQAARRQR